MVTQKEGETGEGEDMERRKKVKGKGGNERNLRGRYGRKAEKGGRKEL